MLSVIKYINGIELSNFQVRKVSNMFEIAHIKGQVTLLLKLFKIAAAFKFHFLLSTINDA